MGDLLLRGVAPPSCSSSNGVILVTGLCLPPSCSSPVIGQKPVACDVNERLAVQQSYIPGDGALVETGTVVTRCSEYGLCSGERGR
jgi:hypothetical protein